MKATDDRPAGPPRASVVVLAYRQAQPLDGCLDALEAQVTDVPFEVTVVINGATPEVVAVADRHAASVRIVESGINLGFAGGCNLGALDGSGEYIVFLNDDAVAAPDWLDQLVAFADDHPQAGAVASLVLFPDGRVQEAGGVVWREGNTTPVGRGKDPTDRHVGTARQIDYGSGCALLVRRAAWEEVGGFDEGYFPAYYEDVDLCLGLRERGWEVWYTPTARVAHLESASSSPHQKWVPFLANEERFRHKWAGTLASHRRHRGDVDAALLSAVSLARGGGLRVLVIDDLAPSTGMGAGYDRMIGVVEALLRRRARVIFHPTATPGAGELARLGVEVVDDLDAFLDAGHAMFDAVVASRPNNVATALRVREWQPWVPVIYDAEALFFRRFERWAELAGDVDAAAAMVQADEWRILERTALELVDTIVTISSEERDWFLAEGARCPVELVPPVPERSFADPAGFAQRRGVVFVSGWLAGPSSPNAHGLRWFADEVLPRLRQLVPWVDVAVTGANPPAELVSGSSSSLRFIGHVDDLADVYRRARVAISPILWGSGVKLKTIGALAHGLPIVSTVIGAEGIPETWRRHLDVTDDPMVFADRLALLLTDRATWESRRAGLDTLLEAHRFDLGEAWIRIIDKAVAHRSECAQVAGVGSNV